MTSRQVLWRHEKTMAIMLQRRRSSNYVHELKMCQVWRFIQDYQISRELEDQMDDIKENRETAIGLKLLTSNFEDGLTDRRWHNAMEINQMDSRRMRYNIPELETLSYKWNGSGTSKTVMLLDTGDKRLIMIRQFRMLQDRTREDWTCYMEKTYNRWLRYLWAVMLVEANIWWVNGWDHMNARSQDYKTQDGDNKQARQEQEQEYWYRMARRHYVTHQRS